MDRPSSVARYAHDTLPVLIDGTYAVHAELWWPALNGASLWVRSDEYWDEENWIASSLSAGMPIGEPQAVCEVDVPGSDYYGWSSGQPEEASLAADARGLRSADPGCALAFSSPERPPPRRSRRT